MKKYEQVIAYFEDAIKESDEIIADCSLNLRAELIEQKGHFITALKATEKQVPKKAIGSIATGFAWQNTKRKRTPTCRQFGRERRNTVARNARIAEQ
jgi:hypothetical protein